jgi:hypothetical protein
MAANAQGGNMQIATPLERMTPAQLEELSKELQIDAQDSELIDQNLIDLVMDQNRVFKMLEEQDGPDMQMFLNHPSVQKMIGRPDLILNMWHNHQDLITGDPLYIFAAQRDPNFHKSASELMNDTDEVERALAALRLPTIGGKGITDAPAGQ